MDAAPQKVVKPSIPAALNSIGVGGYQDIVRSETADIGELQKRKAAGQEEFKTGMGKFSEQRADIGKAQESELGALGAQPKPPVDKFEFHAKDASELGGLLMLLGALGGRNTLQPMTASLNNLTAVMKGQQQGDQLAYTRAADEFKKNFDIGMAKFKEYEQGRKDILAKHKGDMAGLDQEMRHYELMHKGEVSQWDAEIRSRKDRGNAEKAALDAQQRAERLDKTFSLKEKEASGGVKLTDDAQDFFSKVESLGGVPLKFSGRKEAVSAEIELKNKAVKYMRENNITPSQYIANKDIQKSVATAMTALTKVATGQDKMAKKFMGDYEALIELAKTNAAGGNARILNAPINQMRSLFSDPEIKTLAIQADLAATEFERIFQRQPLRLREAVQLIKLHPE